MKCIECGACIKNIGKHKVQCSYTERVMDEKTKQPKWCKDWHKASELQHGIILDDDGYDFSETLMQNEIKYHLSCPECGRTWWSEEAFPEECPYCGAERKITNESDRDKELWRDLILTAFGYIDINELIEKYPEVYKQFEKHRKL